MAKKRSPTVSYSPRQATWLFMRRVEEMNQNQKQALAQMMNANESP